MELSTSQKDNRVLIYNGFEYLYAKTLNGIDTWKCRENRQSKCHSRMKTRNNDIIQEPSSHSHDACPQKAEANIAKRRMVEAMAEINATARNVIGETLSKLSTDVIAYLPKQSSLARTLRNHRVMKHLPNPPTADFAIPEKYRDLVLHDSVLDGSNRILILGDRDLMGKLSQDTLFGDGTFDKAPNMFYQLYTVHAKVGNSYPPCVYILLTKKNEQTYLEMFNILKRLVPDMAPERILLDFEKACMNAARIVFPETEIKGCYFHLCQSIIRKINAVGLKSEYESNIDTRLKLKSLAALSFVPKEDVQDIFKSLASTFPDEDRFNEVLSYFFSTYIQGAAGRGPLFHPRTWNHYDTALNESPRTTNSCEGFHNALNSIFHCSHPSVWTLFDGLRRDLACHKLTLVNSETNQLEPTKRKYRKLYAIVASSVEKYHGTKDKLSYLRKIANIQ
ncbi:uncharacterized protein LOC129777565 isoform X1 [Toxorhynchites rutilus septentrionalis]|uniref:uncharacterized protein LOC129777565 isoform X1 n=1 Tax=Toxorhynchites rutilus septentrionalis TaxID=329112 RepID=UPI0024787DC0|nr:uncharacterized protein LOC129777565 isoform X1 [Toxorhynchites rutilus septentrionalis]